MYAKRASGSFRLRASFRITPELVEGLNVLCAKTGLSVDALCQIAVRRLVDDGQVPDALLSQSRPMKVTAGGEA